MGKTNTNTLGRPSLFVSMFAAARGGLYLTNMATKIKIAGKELNLAYTLHTAVSYEKMTGKNALDLEQFQHGSIEPVITIGYCMINSANPQSEVPDFEDFLKSIDTAEKMTALVQAVMAELTAFFRPTAADKAEKQEDAGKNA